MVRHLTSQGWRKEREKHASELAAEAADRNPGGWGASSRGVHSAQLHASTRPSQVKRRYEQMAVTSSRSKNLGSNQGCFWEPLGSRHHFLPLSTSPTLLSSFLDLQDLVVEGRSPGRWAGRAEGEPGVVPELGNMFWELVESEVSAGLESIGTLRRLTENSCGPLDPVPGPAEETQRISHTQPKLQAVPQEGGKRMPCLESGPNRLWKKPLNK